MEGDERRKHRHRSRSVSPERRRQRDRPRSRSPRQKRRSLTPGDRRATSNEGELAKGERRTQQKKEKESLKAHETPVEKRARRLAKKEAKERKKRKEMGWDEQDLGYTNADNPFGDAHLLQTFVWHKKREKEGEQHLDNVEQRRRERSRQDETRRELEKVKQRRTEREHEMAMREEEREQLQREKESEYYKEWEEQEDQFHLEQAKLRSKIRIQDGRAKPIDLLAQYVSNEDEDLDIQMHEPYRSLVGLTGTDLEDLLEDIKVYMELEQGRNAEFWKDITTICKDELRKLRKKDPSHTGQVDRRESIHSSVNTDVAGIFQKKTYSQLRELQKQINQKIASGDAVDIGYWESLLHQLKAYLAKARLRERHQSMLRSKLADLKKQKTQSSSSEDSESDSEVEQKGDEDDKESHAQKIEGAEDITSSAAEDVEQEDKKENEEEETDEVPQEASIFTEDDLNEQGYIAYEEGKYSPRLLKACDVEEKLLVDPEEDIDKLEILRQEVLSGGSAAESSLIDIDGMVKKEASKGMGADEEAFNVPVPVTQKKYLWSDKYRPRKPRFFNRVHTGYEWNKYNQTHYDSDNPPPKIVQGYKFNIFYPDLIDKTEAPEYYLDPCSDSKDFATLRFHAGPPYEDLAFKIVNREWEYSHRHGFRCQFQNNIFQLWFHFKRYRYRR